MNLIFTNIRACWLQDSDETHIVLMMIFTHALPVGVCFSVGSDVNPGSTCLLSDVRDALMTFTTSSRRPREQEILDCVRYPRKRVSKRINPNIHSDVHDVIHSSKTVSQAVTMNHVYRRSRLLIKAVPISNRHSNQHFICVCDCFERGICWYHNDTATNSSSVFAGVTINAIAAYRHSNSASVFVGASNDRIKYVSLRKLVFVSAQNKS